MHASTQGSKIANCKTVENYEGDLDEHVESDGLKDFLKRV